MKSLDVVRYRFELVLNAMVFALYHLMVYWPKREEENLIEQDARMFKSLERDVRIIQSLNDLVKLIEARRKKSN